MASAHSKSQVAASDDDFFMIDDIDLSDESELRHVVAEVESLVGVPGKGLRLSILTFEQWSTAVTRWLPPARRQMALLHMHALRDPREPQHLVVSPSCVKGINEQQVNIYEELIYWLLRCLPTPLEKGVLRSGDDDLVARICGERLSVALFARHSPLEADLVRALVAVLVAEHDHAEDDWALLLRRDPDRFFLALRKTRFMSLWLACAKGSEEISAQVAGADDPRAALISLLREAQSTKSPFARLTEEALTRALEAPAHA
jgi:hypothetical protein